jgi:NTP pyrophosphatase (non-canonical NTP hydrolase)
MFLIIQERSEHTMDLRVLQSLRKCNADLVDPTMNKDQERQIEKVKEEVSELICAHYAYHRPEKLWSEEDKLKNLKNEIGDVVIALAGYCTTIDVDMGECVFEKLKIVLKRWEKKMMVSQRKRKI